MFACRGVGHAKFRDNSICFQNHPVRHQRSIFFSSETSLAPATPVEAHLPAPAQQAARPPTARGQGVARWYIGIMGKKMETTIMDYLGFRFRGCCRRCRWLERFFQIGDIAPRSHATCVGPAPHGLLSSPCPDTA